MQYSLGGSTLYEYFLEIHTQRGLRYYESCSIPMKAKYNLLPPAVLPSCFIINSAELCSRNSL